MIGHLEQSSVFKVGVVNLGVYSLSSIQKIVVGFIISFWAVQAYAAERAPVLIELFTSQGCSSCPPADALLKHLSKKPNVVALAFHVDYWDYIGWKDSFAQSSFSKRQKTYARLASRTAVYTPQFMINGQTAIAGSEPRALKKEISKSSQRDQTVQISLRSDGNQVQINLNSKMNQKAFKADVLAVYFIPEARVAIDRGENSGRVMNYSNIVTKIEKIGQWNGQSVMRKTIFSKPDQNLAVIVQLVGQGKVIAASKLR